jgi:hypothetical protein
VTRNEGFPQIFLNSGDFQPGRYRCFAAVARN